MTSVTSLAAGPSFPHIGATAIGASGMNSSSASTSTSSTHLVGNSNLNRLGGGGANTRQSQQIFPSNIAGGVGIGADSAQHYNYTSNGSIYNSNNNGPNRRGSSLRSASHANSGSNVIGAALIHGNDGLQRLTAAIQGAGVGGSMSGSNANMLANQLKSGSRIRLRVVKGNGSTSLVGGGANSYINSTDSFPLASNFSGLMTNEEDISMESLSEKELLPISHEQRQAIAAILEDTLDQLIILDSISPGNKIRGGIEKGDRENLFGSSYIARDGKVYSVASAIANAQKIEVERSVIIRLLQSVKSEMDTGCYLSWISYVQQEYSTRNQLQSTINKEKIASETLRSLQYELANERQLFETDINSRNQVIQELKDTIQEIHSLTSAEQRYMKKEMRAHEASVRQQCTNSEASQLEKKQGLQHQLELENKVHNRIMEFLNRQRDVLDRQIQDWMLRYEEDTEQKTIQLENLKQRRSADMDRFEELAAKYEELEKLVDDDRKIKLKEAEQQRTIELQRIASTRIQAWWRGVSFRTKVLPELLAARTSSKSKPAAKSSKKDGGGKKKAGGSSKKSGKKK